MSKIVKKDVLSYCDHYVGFFPILYFAYLNEEKKNSAVYIHSIFFFPLSFILIQPFQT